MLSSACMFDYHDFETKRLISFWTQLNPFVKQVYLKGPPSSKTYCGRLFLFLNLCIVQMHDLIG